MCLVFLLRIKHFGRRSCSKKLGVYHRFICPRFCLYPFQYLTWVGDVWACAWRPKTADHESIHSVGRISKGNIDQPDVETSLIQSLPKRRPVAHFGVRRCELVGTWASPHHIKHPVLAGILSCDNGCPRRGRPRWNRRAQFSPDPRVHKSLQGRHPTSAR